MILQYTVLYCIVHNCTVTYFIYFYFCICNCSWAPYGSFMRWSFQGLVLNEFQNNDDLPLGQDYIDNLGFNTFSKNYCAPIVFVFSLCFGVLLLGALRHINYEKR